MNQTEGVALVVVTHDLELSAKLKREYKLVDGQLFAI
jgi:lipoprotein-releasing system ATP-binding protein